MMPRDTSRDADTKLPPQPQQTPRHQAVPNDPTSNEPASMIRASRRTSLPLMWAILGLVLSVLMPGSLAPALPLLFCPGWGLMRLVSSGDRAFFVGGASLCFSVLVLAGLTLLARLPGNEQPWSAQHLSLAAHGTSILLCALGRLRLARYDRWLRGQPPHPAPMPLWPERTALCLGLLCGSVVAAALAMDLFHPASGSQVFPQAVLARNWAAPAPLTLPLTAVFGPGQLLSAAAAGLGTAASLHLLVATALLSLSSLAACLLLVAESVCRLWGNRGGPGAMTALLVGLNPLVGLVLLASEAGYPFGEDLAAALAPGLAATVTPFVNSSPLTLSLAFTALLLSATLSVLRRSSYDVPRLMALAAFGLVLADVRSALLIVPGWLLGLAWCHWACVHHPDPTLRDGGSGQRDGEPRYLRGPFWRPALHLALGTALGLALVPWPSIQWQWSMVTVWTLLAVVLPGGLLFIPGVRHLNASPGREAYFFLGLLTVALACGLTVSLNGPLTRPLCALLILILAVPTSVGVQKLIGSFGLRAQLSLTVLALALAVAPSLWLVQSWQRPRPVTVLDGQRVTPTNLPLELRQALALVANEAPSDAVLMIDQPLSPEALMACRFLGRRDLLSDSGDSTAMTLATRLSQAEKLGELQGLALAKLRGRPLLAGRELWAISQGSLWPGFQAITVPQPFGEGPAPELLVSRAQQPDVILLTISSLRTDRLRPQFMPHLSARAEKGLRFDTAVTPLPSKIPGLSTLLTGLSPVEHDVRSKEGQLHPDLPNLASSFAERGYRTAAVVALSGDHGLMQGFDHALARPSAHHDSLVAEARRQLASGDRRPLFLWVHFADLELPYDVPADVRTPATGPFSFPLQSDLATTQYGTAAFPPSPIPHTETQLVDVATGIAQYDTSVTELDQALSRLFDSIPPDDLLVVTAPHGTSLDEHDAWFLAGPDLFEPSIRVPLVLVGAGLPASRQSQLTGLQDIAALLLQGQLPQRTSIMLESDWRKTEGPGTRTARAYPLELDPTARGSARRIWGERTETTKTLLTVPPDASQNEAGMFFDLTRDLEETQATPADPFVLRRIDSWRRHGHPPQIDS
ncbi:MAG: arylsulfatase A-like enzyme [Pseudohongiellaceae bacterium]|jgi:arylsulfatase A-like enzyme